MQAGVSKLILAVRDLSKGEKGAQKLQGEVPGYQGSIELWKLDMASFASVREFGERLQSLARLDIFVANAGVNALLAVEPAGELNSIPPVLSQPVNRCTRSIGIQRLMVGKRVSKSTSFQRVSWPC